MKTHAFIVSSLLIAPHLFAGPELNHLRETYRAATIEATKPCKKAYVTKLQELARSLSRQGRHREIDEIDTEFRAIGLSPVERIFLGTAWKTPVGTTFRFDHDGTGRRTFAQESPITFVWTTRKDGVVEIAGETGSGYGRLATWYFRFVGDSEAYFGKSEKEISTKLLRQR